MNKKTLLKAEHVLAEKGINPTEKILELIPTLEPEDQLNAWMNLLSYCQAKPKEDEPDDRPMGDESEVLTASDILDMIDVTPKEEK